MANGGIKVLSPIPEKFTAAAQTFELKIGMTGITSFHSVVRTSWLSVKEMTSTSVTIKMESNIVQEIRTGSVALYGRTLSGGNDVVTTITITQDSYYCYPVWKDVFIDSTTLDDYIDYSLRVGDEIIYSGRANKLPDETKITFNINRIVADYLNSTLDLTKYKEPYFVLFQKNDDAWKTIDVVVNDVVVNSFDFYNNWSYSQDVENTIPTDGIYKLSRPIRSVLDKRQIFLASFLNAYNWEEITHTYTCYYPEEDGSETVTEDMNFKEKGVYTAMNTTIKDYAAIEVYGDRYEVKDTCNKYCLYYSNALGGWDSFLINGNAVKSDKITSSTFVKNVNTSISYDYEKKKYLNQMTTQYVLYTDYLTDDEASRMHHLLESVNVYLHNLETNEIIAVNITNTTCDYKTFKSNGKKKFYYTINVEESQTKMRK